MSEQEDKEEFLSRWSRRKVEARRADPAPGPAAAADHAANSPAAAPAAGAAPIAAPAEASLPPIEELRGLGSEYREFLRPGVDATLRRSALKKLFQDPHFNVMDGLDTYIDDYTKFEPVSAAMLRGLNQAQGLIFDLEERTGADNAAAADVAGGQAPAVPDRGDAAGAAAAADVRPGPAQASPWSGAIADERAQADAAGEPVPRESGAPAALRSGSSGPEPPR